MDRSKNTSKTIASGTKVMLRFPIASDVDPYIYWQEHGDWRTFDAPWESLNVFLSEVEKQEMKKRFLGACDAPQVLPPKRAMVATLQNRPVGSVSYYADPRFENVWSVGIAICEDECLEKGMGTEALRLWVDVLFRNSDMHRLGLTTYSLNPRMIHVAKKIGFVQEGVEREIVYWQDEWIDRIRFGLLRSEWAAL